MPTLVADLRDAIRDHRIQPHFQPQIDLATGGVVAVEALARWTHETRGPVAPADFITAAEDSGLAGDIDRQMLDAACAHLAQWRGDGHAIELAVNVSPPELEDPEFCDTVLATLERHLLPVEALTLELTEKRPLSHDAAATRTLAIAQDAGLRFSVDDYGAGLWVLADVQRLQPQEVKLDRSVIHAGYSTAFADLVEQVRAGGGRVVAEGIETTEHCDTARALGCDRGQGYLLGRPLPPDEVRARLA